MRELNEGRFSLHYENTSKGSFFVIGMGAAEEIQEIQVEQLNYNSFPGILKFNVQYKNNIVYLYYNITSKIGIEQFLNKRKLVKDEFINIIQAIAKTIIKSQNFLIYDENLVIDKKYIYINSSTQEVFLTYLPVKIKADILEDYKDFVMDLIMKSADIEESGNDNYLQRILNKLKSDQFNIESFNKLLCELKSLNSTKTEDNKIQQDIQKVEIIPNKSISKKPSQNKQMKWNYKNSSYIIGSFIQIILISFIVFGYVSGVFSKLKDPVSTFMGLVIIILAGEYLLFRKLFDKKNKKNDNSFHKEIKKQEICSINSQTESNIVIPDKKENLNNINDTEFLGVSANKGAFLKGLKDERVKEIRILKDSFIIGRFKPQVDLVLESKYIGKVHSEIILKDKKYFIKDINSQNGTFINDVRIDSNKDYEIKSGDKIGFAENEYLFFDKEDQNSSILSNSVVFCGN